MRLIRLVAVGFLYVISFFDFLGGGYYIFKGQYSIGTMGIICGLLMFFGVKSLCAKRSL